ncbi:unnamed protein product [Linum trigynum]|uniref:Uncharacterized protein n=1 Tax=Linum trigynum TaxID=586398 RepID=A0AAV2G898_9ROSI
MQTSRLQLTLTTSAQSELVRSDSFPVHELAKRPNLINRVRLFVGLALDVVSDSRSPNPPPPSCFWRKHSSPVPHSGSRHD